MADTTFFIGELLVLHYGVVLFSCLQFSNLEHFFNFVFNTLESGRVNKSFKPYYQIINSPFLSPYISYRRSGENPLKYQENLTSVIMFSILMLSVTDKPLILQ